jgi:hypothetical protein
MIVQVMEYVPEVLLINVHVMMDILDPIVLIVDALIIVLVIVKAFVIFSQEFVNVKKVGLELTALKSDVRKIVIIMVSV